MKKILLVEDNELNRDMLSRRLSRNGFNVSTAEDGQLAIGKAEQLQPDLILMDLSLPVLDGWAATRALKALSATQTIPVIALTAHAQKSDRESALAAGCDDFDTKPVDLERLLLKIILCCPPHTINNKQFHWPSFGFQSQSKLLLNSRKQSGNLGVIGILRLS